MGNRWQRLYGRVAFRLYISDIQEKRHQRVASMINISENGINDKNFREWH